MITKCADDGGARTAAAAAVAASGFWESRGLAHCVVVLLLLVGVTLLHPVVYMFWFVCSRYSLVSIQECKRAFGHAGRLAGMWAVWHTFVCVRVVFLPVFSKHASNFD